MLKESSGAKRRRDPIKTKAHILAEATILFADKGYEGTSLSEIVDATATNKRMIYHYFTDKQGLYRAIFLHQWQQFDKSIDHFFPSYDSEIEVEKLKVLFKNICGAFIDYLSTNQHFTRLLTWEGLEGGTISRSIWDDIRGPIYAKLESYLRLAQKRKIMSAKLEPSHVVISLLGAISFYFIHVGSIGDMTGLEPTSDKALKLRKDQVLLLVDQLFLN